MAATQVNPRLLAETLAEARRRLLAERVEAGHWVGQLSSSALSTATAIFALHSVDRQRFAGLIEDGAHWLVDHVNDDGGWGDTIDSPSNISTTLLAWASLAVVVVPPGAGRPVSVRAGAERWLNRRIGSLDGPAIAAALRDRYGDDRTFAVPILTMLALAGRLGPADQAWRLVEQLPFELAAVPHRWLKFVRLPVVSYALPALIAIGQARHHFRPTRNPVARLIRNRVRISTINKLAEIQPASGGYLEAAPLTSFVVMCLAAICEIPGNVGTASQAVHRPPGGRSPNLRPGAQAREPVPTAHLRCSADAAAVRLSEIIDRGTRFLADTVRPDGSWPIDTNLSGWVTTLSIKALAAGGELAKVLSAEERQCLLNWLLDRQYRKEHPFTHAAPGGWAWTDLSGGVPDADDTPGALLAIALLAQAELQEPFYFLGASNASVLPPGVVEAATAGVNWLIDLQNRDGGMPTFCRGWGRLPFDRSGADLTAHALAAWNVWDTNLAEGMLALLPKQDRAEAYLRRVQSLDGSWLPLWFGNQSHPRQDNPTYGTARVLMAMPADRKAIAWLLAAQNLDGGWGGGPGLASTIEETAVAVEALACIARAVHRTAGGEARSATIRDAIARGCNWLIEHTRGGTEFPAAPIGLYFAKLWYSEKLYPIIFTVAALGAAQRALVSAE